MSIGYLSGECVVVTVCFLAFFTSIWRFYQVVWVSTYCKPTFPVNVKVIHSLIPVALLSRALVMVLNIIEGVLPTGPLTNQTEPYQIILGGIPGYLYLVIYCLISMAFVERFQVFNLETKTTRIIYAIFFSLVIIAFLTFGFLSITQGPAFHFTFTEPIVMASVHAFLSFFYFGMSLFSLTLAIKSHPHKIRHKKQLNIVALWSCVTAVILLAKAALIWVVSVILIQGIWRALCHWLHVLFFEVCQALIVMIILVHSAPKTVGASRFMETSPPNSVYSEFSDIDDFDPLI